MANRPAWRPVTSSDAYRTSNEFGRSHSHSTEGTNPLHANRGFRAQPAPPSSVDDASHASNGGSHSRTVLKHGESGLFHRESVVRYNAVKTGIKPRSIVWHYQVGTHHAPPPLASRDAGRTRGRLQTRDLTAAAKVPYCISPSATPVHTQQKFHAYASCMLFFCFLTGIIVTPFLLLPDIR